MKLPRRVIALFDHQSIAGEFDNLRKLDDVAFQLTTSRHLARRRWSACSLDYGVILLLAITGAPVSFIAGLFTNDEGWYFSAVVWLGIGVALFIYLTTAAKYWREHYPIISEEMRRYGRASFG